MTAGGEQSRLGAAAGEERVEPDGGTDTQRHGVAEKLGPGEPESGAGVSDRLKNADRVILGRGVSFIPGNSTVLADDHTIGEGPAGVDANNEFHLSFAATSVSIKRKQLGQ